MIKRYEGSILAVTPIHHGGNEKTGSTPVLRTMMLFSEELGDFYAMPFVHGNSIRGKYKRLLMKDFFDKIEINPSEIKVKLYHVLFSGGALESTDATSGVMNLEKKRAIQELLIPTSLFGCAIGNDMVQGKIIVDHAMPVCRERIDIFPDYFKERKQAEMPIRTFTSEQFITRKDDLRAERKEDEQATQMKVDYEVLIAGTLFQHGFKLIGTNAVEESCFGRLIEIMKEYPHLGGKGSSGDGQCIFNYTPDPPSSETYSKFVEDNKNDITELISKLEKSL